MHSKVMISKDVWRPVDIMQSELNCRHDTLANASFVVAQRCRKESGKEDIMLVMPVPVWMNL